jgi:ADP-ribose pyrophosphatase YjhB (NUDIX family)
LVVSNWEILRMTEEILIVDNMVVQPALRARLIGMVLAADLADVPGVTCNFIGRVALADGSERGFFVRHAVDAVLSDAAGNVVLITRLHQPGKGRLAIPGGFLDLVDGLCEDVVTAARRELEEETGVASAIIEAAALQGVGRRRYDRPFDVRIAWADIPHTGILTGDIFMASTQPVYLRTAEDLTRVTLRAGDDAVAARVANTREMDEGTLGIPDQLGMIAEIPD